MKKNPEDYNSRGTITRRNFLKVGGIVVAGSTLSMCTGQKEEEGKIKQYRILGRTGFKVSDIGLGGLPKEGSVVRYAYDKGINYFDTAESYGRGEAEKHIGEAMQFMNRKKIWITTKMHFEIEETEEKLLERFGKCLERMKTDYADALYIHGAENVNILDHEGFHAAVKKLKADGRLKHAGLSCHGPQGTEGDSMEKILSKAAEDGRFDLMLMSYNFMNKDEAERVLAVCKKNNIGTTAMKTSPGVISVDPVDPDNLTEDYAEYVERMVKRGISREEAIERMRNWAKEQEKMIEKTRPFAEKYGIKTNEQLRMASLQWVLRNPDMHTVCMGLRDFDDIEKFVPLSGTTLSQAAMNFLKDYQLAFNDRYCRHSCNACVDKCTHKLPVSTIMRYSYYFEMQGREKYAMSLYANLKGRDGSLCLTCDAPCTGACPHGVNIQVNLFGAHALLQIA